MPDIALRPLTAADPDRPMLVVGPSLGTAVNDLWAPVVELLGDRFVVLGWDLPGHGNAPARSDSYTVADLAAALADALTAATRARVHLAGDSLGAAVALQLALDRPELVATLTACCTGAKIGDADGWRERADAVRAGGTEAVVTGSAQRWFAPGFAEREPNTAHRLLEALRTVDDDGYLAACGALADFDVRARLGELGMPVLAVAGSEDHVTPADGLRLVADGARDGRLVILDGVAHLAPVEAPEELARLIGQHAVLGRTAAEARRAGMAVRREVLGDAHVDRAVAATTDLTRDFQDFITQYAWGSVWTRPGLARRDRSLITLTALIALSHDDEFAMHVRAALHNGLSAAEIGEAVLHAAVYVGVPAANTAFRIAQRVLDEEQADGGDACR